MSEPIMTIDKNGTKRWKNKSGEYHRLDGPAIEWADGSTNWYQMGKLHRLDGPAVEFADGWKEWWQNGKRHREDGPAIERVVETVDWFFKDECLGSDLEGFWTLWDRLDEEERQNINLHMWRVRLTNA